MDKRETKKEERLMTRQMILKYGWVRLDENDQNARCGRREITGCKLGEQRSKYSSRYTIA